MWQVASPVAESISRKDGQPLVPQKRRLLAIVAPVRRRIRRMAEARPVTDVVVERFIMLVFVLCFLARRHRGSSDGLRGPLVPFPGPYEAGNDCLVNVCAPGRERGLVARTGPSRRTGYLGSIPRDPDSVKRPKVRAKIAVSSPKLG